MDDMITPISRMITQEKQEVITFEKDFKTGQTRLFQDLKKAEANSKKAGKKTPQMMQTALTNLTNKMDEIDEFKSNNLKAIILLKRERFCNFISQWSKVGKEMDKFHDSSHQSLIKNLENWDRASQAADNVSTDE